MDRSSSTDVWNIKWNEKGTQDDQRTDYWIVMSSLEWAMMPRSLKARLRYWWWWWWWWSNKVSWSTEFGTPCNQITWPILKYYLNVCMEGMRKWVIILMNTASLWTKTQHLESKIQTGMIAKIQAFWKWHCPNTLWKYLEFQTITVSKPSWH
jgi:hypothetical protein